MPTFLQAFAEPNPSPQAFCAWSARFAGTRERGLDAFDTVGLGDHRSPPEHLERYRELCDELGV
jgi:hypothetical protein